MKRLLLTLLLLPSLAVAQVWRPYVTATVPYTVVNAPLITEPAGTISHYHAYGALHRETKANTWTVTTPRTLAAAASAMTPWRSALTGFVTATRPTLGAGSDVMDVANFEVCVAFVPASTTSAVWFLGNGSASTVGYHLGLAAGGACLFNVTTTNITTTNVARPGRLNICCAGRNGTTGSVVLNGGTTATATVATTSDTARIANLGTGNSASLPLTGAIYEMIFVGAAYSDAWARSVVATINAHRYK